MAGAKKGRLPVRGYKSDGKTVSELIYGYLMKCSLVLQKKEIGASVLAQLFRQLTFTISACFF